MIICVTSQKGGVGKSTTAVSMAHFLTYGGIADFVGEEHAQGVNSVLLIDFDPQSHAAISLGTDPAPGIFDWLVADREFSDCYRHTGRPWLQLLPGDSRTKTVERVYSAEPNPHARLVERIRLGEGMHDHIVIDTPASGLLQEAAIAAAGLIVVPVRLEHLGLDGVNATYALAQRLNPGAQVIVLPTQYDARLREHRYNLGVLGDMWRDGGVTVAQAIPARVAVAEAVACGQTVWEHSGRGIEDVRTAYAALVGMILGDGG